MKAIGFNATCPRCENVIHVDVPLESFSGGRIQCDICVNVGVVAREEVVWKFLDRGKRVMSGEFQSKFFSKGATTKAIKAVSPPKNFETAEDLLKSLGREK